MWFPVSYPYQVVVLVLRNPDWAIKVQTALPDIVGKQDGPGCLHKAALGQTLAVGNERVDRELTVAQDGDETVLARSGEVLGARRDEFDLTTNVWTVPAERMKAGKEHRIPVAGPLPSSALNCLARRACGTSGSCYL